MGIRGFCGPQLYVRSDQASLRACCAPTSAQASRQVVEEAKSGRATQDGDGQSVLRHRLGCRARG